VTERASNSTGPASAGPAEEARIQHDGEGERPTVVIRDRRRIKAGGTDEEPAPAAEGEDLVEVPDAEADAAQQTAVAEEVAEELAEEAELTAEAVAPVQPEPEAPSPLGAELEALRGELDERTKDLQRLSAEYANYRKRVDRDRRVVAEQATGAVLAALLPVLDDLDRAREHGDLVGPFSAVAEQLTAALTKFGLTPFGEKGDPFDPTRHEAVAHQTSAEVSEPTCVDVLRRGYLLGERLLRPALVAVADPE
jgi:molecular chaperone GrpE